MTIKPNVTEDDIENRRIRIEALGRIVKQLQRPHFEKLLHEFVTSGVIDITDWTNEAVRALLKVCGAENLKITLKDDTRYFMLVKYSKNQIIDSLTDAIVTGEW
jgi:hypothetical protein